MIPKKKKKKIKEKSKSVSFHPIKKKIYIPQNIGTEKHLVYG